MKELLLHLATACLGSRAFASTHVLHLLDFEGRVAIHGAEFRCAGPFKFAARNSIGSNDLPNVLHLPGLLQR